MLNEGWGRPFQVGIEKPTEEPKSIDEMRKAIMLASRESAIVRNVMMSADYQGLSGEDRYAMLSYYALRQLEDTDKRLLHMLNITPTPQLVMRDEVQKIEARRED